MTRQGLKRIGCTDQCGAIAYMTLAQLERHGVPACPCGAPMYPEAIEVAAEPQHETVRLFTPAPAVMGGQLNL